MQTEEGADHLSFDGYYTSSRGAAGCTTTMHGPSGGIVAIEV